MDKVEYILRIKQIASEQFTTYGYSKVSMDDLSIKLGMSKKTMYEFFPSKEKLLDTIVDEFIYDLEESENKILNDKKLDYNEKIQKLFTEVATKLSAINPYFMEDIRKSTPNVWGKIQQYKSDKAFSRFKTLLDEAEKRKLIRKNINKSLAILLYSSAMESIFNPGFSRQIPEDIRKDMPYSTSAVFEGMVKIIFEGILVK